MHAGYWGVFGSIFVMLLFVKQKKSKELSWKNFSS
jgi:hypothetical protein